MFKDNAIWMGVGAEPDNKPVSLLLDQANRHGLIAGASGTGKTVTLKVMAEGFSKAGVPVFMADVKGDITGMCSPGKDTEDMQKRIKKFGLEGFTYEGCPCRFWDMLGGQGIPVRITVSDMGPTLLSRLLELTEVQEGVLDIVFRIADDKNLLLIHYILIGENKQIELPLPADIDTVHIYLIKPVEFPGHGHISHSIRKIRYASDQIVLELQCIIVPGKLKALLIHLHRTVIVTSPFKKTTVPQA